ncbi:hypothetical protein [Kitasatospora sp. NPDC001175]|uniref:hypothetical protein n=1 Tax=Kitasatospora sp. NPDC001175 TaxID=3157103 RepID=UPI003CFCDD8E
MSIEYSLTVCDLVTDRLIDRLPIAQVQYEDYIGRTGTLTGTIPIPDSATAQRARAALIPGRTMVYLTDSAGTIAWGGPLWTATPTRDARGYLTCPVQAGTLEGVLRSHRIAYDNLTWTATDQLDIARGLVDYAQAQPGGNLGIEIDRTQLSGVTRDRTYSSYDLPHIGDLLDQLAAVGGGFEWRIQLYTDTSGVRHRALRLGYPILTAGSADVLLSSPGEITAYSLPQDAGGMATTWQSRGASSQDATGNSVPLMSALQTSPDLIAAGWPRLDGSSDYSTVSVQATLDGHATADLARARQPVTIPAVSWLRLDTASVPPLGSYIRLRIADDWFTEGLSARYRLVGLRVTPVERGRAESVELFLEAA